MPGETVKFKATIENKCSKDVVHNCVKLMRTAFFHAKDSTYTELLSFNNPNNTKNVEQVVVSIQIEKLIGSNQTKTLSSDELEPLVIPPLCPTETGLCDIINISYALVFTFAVKNSIDKNLVIPIVIGTVPLGSDSSNLKLGYSEAPPCYDRSVYPSITFENQEKTPIKGEMYDTNADVFKPLYPSFA